MAYHISSCIFAVYGYMISQFMSDPLIIYSMYGITLVSYIYRYTRIWMISVVDGMLPLFLSTYFYTQNVNLTLFLLTLAFPFVYDDKPIYLRNRGLGLFVTMNGAMFMHMKYVEHQIQFLCCFILALCSYVMSLKYRYGSSLVYECFVSLWHFFIATCVYMLGVHSLT